MLRCEAIGDNHIKTAAKDIAEVKELITVITEKMAKEENTYQREQLDEALTKLQSAMDSARMGTEFMKVATNAAYELIGAQITDEEGKFQKMAKYRCKMCSFNVDTSMILEDHVK